MGEDYIILFASGELVNILLSQLLYVREMKNFDIMHVSTTISTKNCWLLLGASCRPVVNVAPPPFSLAGPRRSFLVLKPGDR